MPEKPKTSHRDSALVSILGRMADHLQKQDQMLEDVIKSQLESIKATETAEVNRKTLQFEADATLEKLHESVSRYRSDMLSLVNEQDHINKNLNSLNNLINKTNYVSENANQQIAVLGERISILENTVNGHNTHSLEQAEIIPKTIADSNRNLTMLHIETEKNLEKLHQETQRQLEKLQQETVRRLLVLEDVESALETLLIRTEPPEKKPFWVIRLYRRISVYFRSRLPRRFRRKRPRRKG